MFNLINKFVKKKSIFGAFSVFILVALVPSLALAEFSNTPDEGTWITNGVVKSVVEDPVNPDVIYLGGNFTYVGPNTGSGAKINTSTGAIITSPSLAGVRVNGNIITSISDGAGGFYIGGAFTKVGTTTRNRIAHILPNGSLDPDFNPNADGQVTTLALSSNGAILYAGGSFTSIGGALRNSLAALNTTTGLATVFDPNADDEVQALLLSSDGSTLYVGGSFTFIGDESRSHIAALNTTTGLATIFNPGITGKGSVRSLALF